MEAKSTPRDVFMYLLATITLYFSAYSVIDLLFGYINAAFPDYLNYYYSPGDAIRWSLALFIIIFPVYLWVMRFLHRDMIGDPAKRDIKIRKWLLYLTIFLAALLAIGDLVALIYNFLDGEVTARFLLKILSVFLVAAAVFWYYLYDLRRMPGPLSRKASWFVRGIMVAWLVIVIAGIAIAGSPFKQRLVRFDQQKVTDLQNIQQQIVDYWQRKSTLPNTLDDLTNTISGFAAPKDPQSGNAYQYEATGKLTFKLCADFNLDSKDGLPPNYPTVIQENWQHGAGNICFDRVIDPEIYKPYPTNTIPMVPKPIPANSQ